MQRGILAAVLWIALGMGEALAVEKGQYNLFKPVPVELLREMSTDRPDKTESPYTVDAGHFQVEESLLDYTYDQRNSDGTDIRTDSWSIVPMNLKIGLFNNADFQLVLNPSIRERSEGDGEKENKEGFGDVQTRLKVNVWGNDGGSTAFAVMPFVKFPTNTGDLGNKAYEGGIILPLAVSLPAEWSMGVMTEFDFNRNEDKDYYTDFINTVTFGHQIIGDLDGYMEFFSSFNREENSPWVGTVDLGLTYAVSKHIQLDGGVNIGVTNSADDFNPFLGLSVRY
jgi:hypothetical protein